MKKRWILLAVVAAAVVWFATLEPLPTGHDEPYSTVAFSDAPSPDNILRHRVILFGDAGESSPDPLQPSLSKAVALAAESPANTSVLALGDNIYYRGFPVLEDGQGDYDKDQLEDIGHLRAQLQVAKRSGAPLYLLPGNHDWYAGQTDDQRAYIATFAAAEAAPAALKPESGELELLNRDGISLLFIDSQVLITADQAKLNQAMQQFAALLEKVPAGNVLLLAAHHPTETMGPHARFYTSRAYQGFIAFIELFLGNDQDIDSPGYARYISALNRLLADYPGKAIYAAGHDHNLQVFGSAQQAAPQYRLVSGAANTSKVTGVGDNDNTLFAVAREGLMSLDVHRQGTWLRVWTIDSETPVFQYRLW